jgi:MoxR-like ATPase
MATDVKQIGELVKEKSEFVRSLFTEMDKVIIGQRYMLERMLIGLLANGHILLEGVPGLAKTMAVTTLSRAINADFKRIQFTPDLLPADLIGTQIYRQSDGKFQTRKGPIFANIILADEINRAPAKVQSALLEAMQERQITIGHTTYHMEQLFLVLATQNPIEQEGTYPLPEAQVDRFMMKVIVDYPKPNEERLILDRMTGPALPSINPIISPAQILRAREMVRQVYVDDKIKNYVLNLVLTTRNPGNNGLSDLRSYVAFGASPRAGINLILAARAHAFIKGRGFVTPEDIKQVAPDVLRHRVITTYEAEAENVTSADIVQRILDYADVP